MFNGQSQAQQFERNAIRLIQEHSAKRYLYQFKVEQAKSQIMFCFNQIYTALQLKQQQLLDEIDSLHARNFQNDHHVKYLSRLTCKINQQKQCVLNGDHEPAQSTTTTTTEAKEEFKHTFDRFAQHIKSVPHMVEFAVRFDLQQMHRLLAELDGLLTFNTTTSTADGVATATAAATVATADNRSNIRHDRDSLNQLHDSSQQQPQHHNNHHVSQGNAAIVKATSDRKQQLQQQHLKANMNGANASVIREDIAIDKSELVIEEKTAVAAVASISNCNLSENEVLQKCSKYLAMEQNRGVAWYDTKAKANVAGTDHEKKYMHNWDPVWMDEKEQVFIDSHGVRHNMESTHNHHQFVTMPRCVNFAELCACITKLRNGYIRWIQQIARNKTAGHKVVTAAPTMGGTSKQKNKKLKQLGPLQFGGGKMNDAEKFLIFYAKKHQLAMPQIMCRKNVIKANEDSHVIMYDAELVFNGKTFTASAKKKKLAKQMCFKSAMKQIKKHPF